MYVRPFHASGIHQQENLSSRKEEEQSKLKEGRRE